MVGRGKEKWVETLKSENVRELKPGEEMELAFRMRL